MDSTSTTVSDPQELVTKAKNLYAEERYGQAAEQFDLAHQVYAKAGEELEAAEMMNNVGVAYQLARQQEKAAHALKKARESFARLQDRDREAQVIGNLGGLYAKMKRYDDAEACYETAIDIFQELDDRGRQAQTLRALALMQFRRGQRSEALNIYEEALYFLPNPTMLQRIARFLLRIRGLLVGFSPLR